MVLAALPPARSLPEFKRNLQGMLLRRLHNWEAAQRQRLFLLVTPHLIGGAISMGVRQVREDLSRDPKYRRPEPEGFALDHEEGERWRRFKLQKTR
jgi:hypothetical protein